MTDLDSLLAAVLAEPECDTARLVYADALEETQVPANVARSEFIRLQIAIAKGMRVGATATKLRAISIFKTWKDKWFAIDNCLVSLNERRASVAERIGIGIAVVRRGFIHTVRGQLDVLRDGECGCENGGVDTGGTTPWGAPISVRCEECQGTGRTPGILRELVRREPVEVVEVTDCEPWENDISESSTYRWNRETNIHDVYLELGDLPADVFDLLPVCDDEREAESDRWVGHVTGSPLRSYHTEPAARAALSNALLAEAKGPVPA